MPPPPPPAGGALDVCKSTQVTLPPSPHRALPECYHFLVENPQSPLREQYPTDFPVDTEGCRFAWEGVALLPRVDFPKMCTLLRPLEARLAPEERRRNAEGPLLLYVHATHPLAAAAAPQLYPHDDGAPPQKRFKGRGAEYPFPRCAAVAVVVWWRGRCQA